MDLSVRHSGYLNKKGGNVKNWKRRFCVLADDPEVLYPCLVYYEESDCRSCKGQINAEDIIGVRSRCPPYRTPIFEISTLLRTYMFQADTEEEMERWIHVLQRASPGVNRLQTTGAFVKQGILSKEGGLVKSWKTRIFTLLEDPTPRLTYSDPDDTSAMKGDIDLRNASAPRVDDIDSSVMLLDDGSRVFKLKAETEDELELWMVAIADVLRNRQAGGTSAQSRANKRKSGLAGSVLKQGWMKKQGGSFKTWKRRFFVLQRKSLTQIVLSYYDGPDSQVALGEVSLSEISNVAKKDQESLFTVVTPNRTYFFEANSEQDADIWIFAIDTARKQVAALG